MAESSEINHLLQLQLRAGLAEAVGYILRNLNEGDWFQDENGLLWEWGFDIDANLHRWFETDICIVGYLVGTRERPELDGAAREFIEYGWNGALYRRVNRTGPYRLFDDGWG